ncbi:hypothetical protein Tco_0215289 [Tanacetum coccineum]
MSRRLFLRIVNDIDIRSKYFQQRQDAKGTIDCTLGCGKITPLDGERNSHDKAAVCGGCWGALGMRLK